MSSSHSPLAAGGEDTCQVAARRDTAQRSTTQPRAAHRSPPQPAASAADATCRDKVASIAHLAMQAPVPPPTARPASITRVDQAAGSIWRQASSEAHLCLVHSAAAPGSRPPLHNCSFPQTLSSLQGPSHCTVLGSSMH
ncbi:MAG: hypothetical protein WDW36_005564 [Sanguina aurantia]